MRCVVENSDLGLESVTVRKPTCFACVLVAEAWCFVKLNSFHTIQDAKFSLFLSGDFWRISVVGYAMRGGKFRFRVRKRHSA